MKKAPIDKRAEELGPSKPLEVFLAFFIILFVLGFLGYLLARSSDNSPSCSDYARKGIDTNSCQKFESAP